MERYAFRYRYDVTSTVYTFTDKPATVTHTHTASGKDSRTEAYTYSYDHADRLSKVEHTLGGAKVTLAAYAYDNLGRLQSKSLHGSDADRQAYAYNVRGWLTGISGTKFTQNLYYNTGNGPAKYNGSISSMTWKAGTASTVRGYKSTYDGLDRLLNATYGETAGISTNANRFSENVTGYDKNGNIKGLQRYGQTGASAYGLLDNLTFTLNGNQLSRVEDAVSTAAYGTNTAFVNGASAAGEYAYDVNGNLTKDLNKGITDIQYNVLNLPSTVSFSDGSTITYTYGADGTKLRTVHKIGSTTTTTDYCGNVIYENGTQKLLLTEEGYINLTGTQQYHYYLKDHQGNNRVVINQSGTVEETNHYYPFGGVFGTTGNTQPYKYNGKEKRARYRCKICDRLTSVVFALRMAIPVDLRIKKTYRALFDAFTELLEEHHFEDLTVAMLCDRAMIRRTTFYKHFRDKNDYFAFYIDELMSGLPQKQPDEAGAVSAEDVRALRHAILDDAMDLILAHERLMDNILASSMSGMLTNVICDRIARSIRERVMNVLAEDALAPVSLETTSEFVAGGIIRLFTIWWESGHDLERRPEMADVVDALFERTMTPVHH